MELDTQALLIEFGGVGWVSGKLTYSGLSLGDLDLDFAKSRVELHLVDLLVAIETVEVSESSAESTDGLGASGLDLGSNLVED